MYKLPQNIKSFYNEAFWTLNNLLNNLNNLLWNMEKKNLTLNLKN